MPAKSFEEVVEALVQSLARLQLEYVDLYLLHAPFCKDARLEQWRALVQLKAEGKVRAIGVSNYNVNHIEEIINAKLPLPCSNQIELHPYCQKKDLVSFMRSNEILPIAYSSLVPLVTWRVGQKSRKSEALITSATSTEDASKTSKHDAERVLAMAQKYNVTDAQLLLKWAVQQGIPILPKSTRGDRIRANINIDGFEIDARDMDVMATWDKKVGGVAWSSGDPCNAP